jgi:hypothetical protein
MSQTDKNWYRQGLEKKYNHLYKKDYSVPKDICRYCGSSFYCYDHRPAISQLPNMDIIEYQKEGGKFILIPACRTCNAYLNDRYFLDVLDCLFFLRDKYRAKLSVLPPIWGKKDIIIMSPQMQDMIIEGQMRRNIIVDKIENIYTHICTYDEAKNKLQNYA